MVNFIRHLDESQRGMVGARLKPYLAEEAKKRQTAAQNNNAGKAVGANLPEQVKGRARDRTAEAVNVSARTVEHAAKVLETGTDGGVTAAHGEAGTGAS